MKKSRLFLTGLLCVYTVDLLKPKPIELYLLTRREGYTIQLKLLYNMIAVVLLLLLTR